MPLLAESSAHPLEHWRAHRADRMLIHDRNQRASIEGISVTTVIPTELKLTQVIACILDNLDLFNKKLER